MMSGKKILAMEIALLMLLSYITLSGCGVVGAASDLVYDDFDDGSLGTNLGGNAGSCGSQDQYNPTLAFETGHDSAKSLCIQYNIQPGEWGTYWSYFQDDESGYDISAYTHLTMWVKSEIAGRVFKVELKDTWGTQKYVYITQLENFRDGTSTTWQQAEFPLSLFSGIDLKNVTQLNITFDREPWTGTVYIDEIKFVTKPLPPATIRISAPDSAGSGETFRVKIEVDPQWPVAGVQFDLKFDQTKLTVEKVEEGSFLGGKATGTWVGYWTFLREDQSGYDVSGYGSLSLRLKGDGGEKFKIELADTQFDPNNPTTYNHKGEVNVGPLDSDFSTITIPLENFTHGNSLNLMDLKQVNILFNQDPRFGTLYVDEISFGGSLFVDTFEDNDSTNDLGGASGTMESGDTTVFVSSSYEGGCLILNYNRGATYFYSGDINNADGTVKWVYGTITSPGGYVSKPGTFAVITMRAKDGVSGTAQLSLENVVIGDPSAKPIQPIVVNDNVNIQSFDPEDVNMDGDVNLLDLIIVGQHWRETGAPGWIRADVNRDGKVDLSDIIMIGQKWTG